MNINLIENPYSQILLTKIRNTLSSSNEIREAVFELGKIVGQDIIVKKFSNPDKVKTPMNQYYDGIKAIDKPVAIISTKDDFNFFADGLAQVINNCIKGYMDFGELRGQAALNTPVRAIVLPDLKFTNYIDTLIIAKSVLATGCTAISLTKKAVEKYNPKSIIIVTLFHSLNGIQELSAEFPHAEIYVFESHDELDENGMLSPGVGNIDKRLNDVKTAEQPLPDNAS